MTSPSKIVAIRGDGIGLRDVTYEQELIYGQGVLVTVHGTIENSSDYRMPLPKSVRITLSDAKNKELYHTDFAPNVASLGPRQSVGFVTKIYDVPSETRHMDVRLAGS